MTQVRFSASASLLRAFSGSVDKTFRVYDVPSKTLLRHIQVQSPIQFLEVDQTEQFVYLGCQNLNVYQVPLVEVAGVTAGGAEATRAPSKKTMTHKRRITAMCLSRDGQLLVSGDSEGLIYVWHIRDVGAGSGPPRLQTFELHKDKGAITNLVAFNRPLSLFGLTANMQGYEPGEFKSLKRATAALAQQDQADPAYTLTVQLDKREARRSNFDQSDETGGSGIHEIAELAELQYMMESATVIGTTSAAAQSGSGGKAAGSGVPVAQGTSTAQKVEEGQTFAAGDQIMKSQTSQLNSSEIHRLREENKRLKKTLETKFKAEDTSMD